MWPHAGTGVSLLPPPLGCLPTTGRLQRKPAPTYWGHSGCIPTLLGHPWGSRGPRGRRQQAEPPQDCRLGPVERAAVGELCPGKRRGGAGRVRTRRRLCFFTAWPPACTAAPPWPPKVRPTCWPRPGARSGASRLLPLLPLKPQPSGDQKHLSLCVSLSFFFLNPELPERCAWLGWG